MAAMAAGCAFQFGMPFLIPALRDEGLSLAEAGLLTSAPVAGLLATLVAWGAAADRWGERGVLTIGLTATGLILSATALVNGTAPLAVCLVAAGAASAAVNASSGRLILGWFGAHERGLAMGLRQTALPLGVGLAALTLPSMTRPGALVFLGSLALAAAVLVALVVRDSPSTTRSAPGEGTPYRTPVLWRIHAASALLVVPQATVATFALVFLVDVHGWQPASAGRLLALGQVGGALARLVAGWWSDRLVAARVPDRVPPDRQPDRVPPDRQPDRVPPGGEADRVAPGRVPDRAPLGREADRLGGRLRPMRLIALAIAAVVAGLALGAHPAVLLAAAVLTVSPNGLAYTAVAERAGPAWAGRALGIQNTAQNLAGVATVPAMAALIAATGYRPAFAAAAVFPLAAALLTPVSRWRRLF
ncbi:MFS transporter [Actinoplanes sp. NPDC051513]|uniref:MFS transporter n=1 Tax=Actinoplanes sp. NPDC051513 TaxID=3363908 RepID=UPI0037AB50D4